MSNYSIFPKTIKDLLLRDMNELKEREDFLYDTEAEYNRAKTYRNRARQRARKAIMDLTWYAKTQPEDQVKQVFQEGIIKDLVGAILGLDCLYLKEKNQEENLHTNDISNPQILKTIFRLLSTVNRAINNAINPQTLQELQRAMPVDSTLFDIRNIITIQKMLGLTAYKLRESMHNL